MADVNFTEEVKRKILIVEDNFINREMLKGILEERYTVYEAENGEEGLKLLADRFRELSLVLLDVQMPVMDGYEFLERKKNDELLVSVPVIVTTGNDGSEDEERCLSLGASDFVTKPYNPKVILRRIEAIIRLNESIATLNAIEFDTLTGLYTKKAFYHHAGIRLGASSDEHFDLLMINVENFSYINERYGESVGDKLLKHIGECILSYCHQAVICCRYHADRFILMRKHTYSDHKSETVKFRKYILKNSPVADCIIKFACYDDIPHEVPVSVLCDRLALAIGTIKHQYNRTVAFYDEEMSERQNRARYIEECMEEAVREGQFKVFYQPKMDIRTGKLAGAEALVRWCHPEMGFLSPAEFIPLFEENGFITALDLFVWKTVCRDLKDIKSAAGKTVPVSVNASRHDFLAIDSADEIMSSLKENGLSSDDLHIEITESAEIENTLLSEKISAVRNRGIAIELDDFGSGRSSLGTLHELPVDVIKLDIGFARALPERTETVRMIILLSHALGYKTVAEGVETEEQLSVLKSLGCDYVQGYYYSKPVTKDAFLEFTEVYS